MTRRIHFLIPCLLLAVASCTEEKSPKLNYTEADEYVNAQLDTNMMHVDFNLDQAKELYYSDEFDHNGLLNIRGYCNKKYYKKSRNRGYDNYTLWVFEYEGEVSATNAINVFIEDMSLGHYETYSMSKSGNFIVQNGSIIYSLVEACSGGDYREREELFLKTVLPEKNDAIILNADCGDMNYKIESE